jgi:hypothetical protein
MAMKLEYKSSDNYLLATVEGIMMPHNFNQAMDEITSPEGYPPDVSTIWDFREVDFRPGNEGLARSLVYIRKTKDEKRGNTKVAIVVADCRFYNLVFNNTIINLLLFLNL